MLHHARPIDPNFSAAIFRIVDPATAPAFDMKTDFFDALSRGDIEHAGNTFAEDGTLLFPGLRPVRGRALVKRMLGAIRRRYDDIRWKPTLPALASSGWIVTGWSVCGTFKNSQLPYRNEVLSLIQLDENGHISLLSDYFKDTQAFRPSQSMATARANA